MGDRAAEARRILEETYPEVEESVRVLRCIAYLAEGDVARLAELAEHARGDCRDVIFWAEYTGHDRPSPRRVRDFTKPFDGQKIGLGTPRLPSDVKRSLNRSRARRQRRRSRSDDSAR